MRSPRRLELLERVAELPPEVDREFDRSQQDLLRHGEHLIVEGRAKDQINRELKAGKLLSISLGNRGQRVPDWQLVPLKLKLAQVMLNQLPDADAWDLYHLLTKPHPGLDDRSAIDIVTPTNLGKIVQVLLAPMLSAPEGTAAVTAFPEPVRESVQRLLSGVVTDRQDFQTLFA